MDTELCQLNKIYLSDLAKYNKIIVQRNKLLKDFYFRNDISDTLDIWDLQLCEYGQKIIEMREAFVERLNEIIYNIRYNYYEQRFKKSCNILKQIPIGIKSN